MIKFLVHQMMLPILSFFYDLTHSYGWAIVLLTLSVKLLLMPLTFKQFKSILAMQRLQPKLKELQKRYKDNPEELNKRMIEFYRENKVNPFGGCLPILFQMPFLIALYGLLTSSEFAALVKNEGSFLFIQNLANAGLRGPEGLHFDIIALIILFGLTTFASQKMMMVGDDPMQKQMLYLMPIMITATFVFMPIPAGVLLYMLVSNLISIIQNVFMMRERNRVLTTGDIPASGVDLSGPTGKVIPGGSDSKGINKKERNDKVIDVAFQSGDDGLKRKKSKKKRKG